MIYLPSHPPAEPGQTSLLHISPTKSEILSYVPPGASAWNDQTSLNGVDMDDEWWKYELPIRGMVFDIDELERKTTDDRPTCSREEEVTRDEGVVMGREDAVDSRRVTETTTCGQPTQQTEPTEPKQISPLELEAFQSHTRLPPPYRVPELCSTRLSTLPPSPTSYVQAQTPTPDVFLVTPVTPTFLSTCTAELQYQDHHTNTTAASDTEGEALRWVPTPALGVGMRLSNTVKQLQEVTEVGRSVGRSGSQDDVGFVDATNKENFNRTEWQANNQKQDASIPSMFERYQQKQMSSSDQRSLHPFQTPMHDSVAYGTPCPPRLVPHPHYNNAYYISYSHSQNWQPNVHAQGPPPQWRVMVPYVSVRTVQGGMSSWTVPATPMAVEHQQEKFTSFTKDRPVDQAVGGGTARPNFATLARTGLLTPHTATRQRHRRPEDRLESLPFRRPLTPFEIGSTVFKKEKRRHAERVDGHSGGLQVSRSEIMPPVLPTMTGHDDRTKIDRATDDDPFGGVPVPVVSKSRQSKMKTVDGPGCGAVKMRATLTHEKQQEDDDYKVQSRKRRQTIKGKETIVTTQPIPSPDPTQTTESDITAPAARLRTRSQTQHTQHQDPEIVFRKQIKPGYWIETYIPREDEPDESDETSLHEEPERWRKRKEEDDDDKRSTTGKVSRKKAKSGGRRMSGLQD